MSTTPTLDGARQQEALLPQARFVPEAPHAVAIAFLALGGGFLTSVQSKPAPTLPAATPGRAAPEGLNPPAPLVSWRPDSLGSADDGLLPMTLRGAVEPEAPAPPHPAGRETPAVSVTPPTPARTARRLNPVRSLTGLFRYDAGKPGELLKVALVRRQQLWILRRHEARPTPLRALALQPTDAPTTTARSTVSAPPQRRPRVFRSTTRGVGAAAAAGRAGVFAAAAAGAALQDSASGAPLSETPASRSTLEARANSGRSAQGAVVAGLRRLIVTDDRVTVQNGSARAIGHLHVTLASGAEVVVWSSVGAGETASFELGARPYGRERPCVHPHDEGRHSAVSAGHERAEPDQIALVNDSSRAIRHFHVSSGGEDFISDEPIDPQARIVVSRAQGYLQSSRHCDVDHERPKRRGAPANPGRSPDRQEHHAHSDGDGHD